MSLPSIRECEQKLAALAGQPASDERMAQALGVGRALLHYVRNSGTPPAPPLTPRQRAMSLAPLANPQASQPAHLVRKPEPMPRPAAAPAPAKAKRLPFVLPPDRVTKLQLAERAGFSRRPAPLSQEDPAGWVSAARFAERLGLTDPNRIHLLAHDGRIQPAGHREGRRVFWAEAYVAQIVSSLVIQRRKPRQG